MRSDAKASTAGSTQRQAGRLGRIFRGALGTRASSPGDPGSGASATRRLVIPTAVLATIVAGLVLLAGLAAAATSAITEPATNIGGTHATLNGVVNPDGVEPEECFFEWGEGFSGAYTETTSCAETPAEIGSGTSPVSVHADITGLAPQGTYYHFRLAVVDPSETLYGTSKYFSTLYDVVTESPSANTGTRATLAGTVNPEGVEPEECFFEWGETSSYGETVACAETPAEIGSGTSPVSVHADITGLTPQSASYHYRLVVVFSPSETLQGYDKSFNTPNTVITEAATGITPTEATLNGTVNPDTATISACVFEWGEPKSETESIQTYPETAACVPGPGAITGTSPVAVHADLSGLHPGTEYVYRLKAAYPTGPILSAQASLRAAGPAIEAAWSEGVVRTEATLKALINPEGSATTYRFEWGTTAAYGDSSEGSVGSDSSVHQVTQFLTSLQPDTTYHYRVVATSSVGTNEGPDQTFATYAVHAVDANCANQAYRYGPGANLPDCRGYEMVSPIDKNGADIETLEGNSDSGNYVRAEINQASLNGDKYSFSSYKAFAGAPSGMYSSQYLATRGSGGWSTEGISLPFTGGPGIVVVSPVGIETYTRGFSDDLSRTWAIDPSRPKLLSPDAVDGLVNLYERNNGTGAVHPLTVGEKLTEREGIGIEFYGATPDDSVALFSTEAALTPDAALNNSQQIYAYSNGSLELISVLPSGDPDPGDSVVGSGSNAVLRGNFSLQHAISDNGSRVFWSTEKEYGRANGGKIYVRIDGERTVPVSEGNQAWFWAATPVGSRAIYGEGGLSSESKIPTETIYQFDVGSETRTPIAGEAMGVLGASDDLSRIYFVSAEDLAPGAVAGEPNLYLDREGSTAFIASLAMADVGALATTTAPPPDVAGRRPIGRTSRISADGRYITFMSSRSLTGYDNTNAAGVPSTSTNGAADYEVFRYDADTEKVTCVSCNPSGARPHGRALAKWYNVDRDHTNFSRDTTPVEYWAAAWLPTWETSLHASRALSEDGSRVFFNSYDPLVPEDTNGKQDVYQWEAPGAGTCTVGGRGYSKQNEGCVSLISTGQSSEYSEFMDASASGDRVFLRTDESIYPEDPFGLDIYAATAGGGYPPPPGPPTACEGDACQNIPSPPQAASPASARFKGVGNPTPRLDCTGPARRAVKLSHRAKRLRHAARRSHSVRRSKLLRSRAARSAKQAKRLSRNAKRCRRAVRRVGR